MVWSEADTNEVAAILVKARKYSKEINKKRYDLDLGITIFENLLSENPLDQDGTLLSDANRTALKNRCIAKINTMLPADD